MYLIIKTMEPVLAYVCHFSKKYRYMKLTHNTEFMSCLFKLRAVLEIWLNFVQSLN